MLSWLWPVQDLIIKYELQYWEADSEGKVGMLSLSSWHFNDIVTLSCNNAASSVTHQR